MKSSTKEYHEHLVYYIDHPQMYSSKFVPESVWGDKEAADIYLQKYWLPEEEYSNVWRPIQEEIFIFNKNFPEMVYKPGFEFFAIRGGALFAERDFNELQNAMQEIGEQYFVVIQHSQDFREGEPMFRMKFPVDIRWGELMSGNYISSVLLEMSANEYLVFGSNTNWGKYVASDYDYPLDIIGFTPALRYIFRKHIDQSEEALRELIDWVPYEYSLIK